MIWEAVCNHVLSGCCILALQIKQLLCERKKSGICRVDGQLIIAEKIHSNWPLYFLETLFDMLPSFTEMSHKIILRSELENQTFALPCF